MSGAIKGITIEISGNTTKLDAALKDVNAATRDVNKELRQVKGLLRFNPGSTELLAQKQALLSKQIANTASKLNTLKEAQAQVESQFKSGNLGAEEYRAFQREVISTESKLKTYQSQLKSSQSEQQQLGRVTEQLQGYFKATGHSVTDFSDILGPKLTTAISEGRASAAQMEEAINKIGRATTSNEADLDKFKGALKSINDGGSLEHVKGQLDKVTTSSDGTAGSLKKIEGNTFASKMGVVANGAQQASQGLQHIAGSAMSAANDMRSSYNSMITDTGASGKAADDLKQRFDNLYTTMKTPQPEILAKTISGVSNQFQATGKDLESLSKSFFAFTKVTGQDATEAVTNVHQAMERFNVSATDAPKILDSFADAARMSGKTVGELEQNAMKAAPAFEQMHMSLGQGVKMLGIWSHVGIDNETVLKGLQKASVAYAKSGKGLNEGLQQTTKAIKAAKSPQEALNAGVAAFGAKAGPAMVKAIRDNKISLTDLAKTSESSTGTVKRTLASMDGKSSQSAVAMQGMKKAMAAVGDTIQSALVPVFKALTPIVQKVAKVFGKLPAPVKQFIAIAGGLTVVVGFLAPVIAAVIALQAALLPIIGVIAGVAAAIAIGILIFKNWGNIVKWVQNVFKPLAPFFRTVMSGIKACFAQAQAIFQPFLSAIGQVVGAVKTIFGGIIHVVQGIFNLLMGIFTGNGARMHAAIGQIFQGIVSIIGGILRGAIGIVSGIFGTIVNLAMSILSGLIGAISGILSAIVGFFGSILGGIFGIVSGIFNGVVQAVTHPMKTAKGIIHSAIKAIKSFFNFKIHWPHIPLPHFHISGSLNPLDWLKGGMPKIGVDFYALGGIMTQPTIFGMANGKAQVGGEAGPEAVLPLNEKNLSKIGAAIAATMPQKNQPIVLQVDGRTFAQITGSYTDVEGGMHMIRAMRGVAE